MAITKINDNEYTLITIEAESLVQFSGVGDVLVAKSASPDDLDWIVFNPGDYYIASSDIYVKGHRGSVVVLPV